jgi:hypothetical protein
MGDHWNVFRAEDAAAADDPYEGEQNDLVVYGNVKPQSEHIARWDPARVLREVEAKRRIVDWVVGAQAAAGEPPGFDPADAEALTHAVRLLALPYADRPGYDEAWRPTAI